MTVNATLEVTVALASGPGSVDDLLREAMERLRETYPSCSLRHVSIAFSATERPGEPERREMSWTVQANNERGYGDDSRQAFQKLAQEWEEAAIVPEIAARVADILRELPDRGFTRTQVISAATEILDRESRERRGR